MRKILISVIVLGVIGCGQVGNKRQSEDSKTAEHEIENKTPGTNQIEKQPNDKDELNDTANTTIAKKTIPTFIEYIKSLDTITLPLTHKIGMDLPKISENYNKLGFDKYRHIWTEKPLGLLYNHKNTIVTIDLGVGDYGYVPFVMTYDFDGNKIDSLGAFKKSGYDMGYESVEYVTFQPDWTIEVIDTTKRWKLNEERDDIIEDSLTISMDTVIYKISKEGKIKQK